MTTDKAELMDSVLWSLEDHHDRGDETVPASDIAMALGEDEGEVRDMMKTLVGSGHVNAVLYWHPENPKSRCLLYWLAGYEGEAA